MKTKIITIALITITSITSQLIAQEATSAAPLKASYDLAKGKGARVSKTDGNVTPIDDWQEPKAKVVRGNHIPKGTITCRVTSADNGCVITMENNIVSPRDAASGLPTGKRMHKSSSSFHISSADNSVTEVKSPRDAASGLATGKRMHKPLQPISTELDKASPKLLETVVKGKSSSSSSSSEIAIDEPGVHKVASSGGGAGKASFSDLSVMSAGKATFKEFTVTKRCDGKTSKIVCPNGDCEIPLDDCPNGTCDLVCEWSWGLSQSGNMSPGSGSTGLSSSSVGFSLEIQDGACTAMAINEKH